MKGVFFVLFFLINTYVFAQNETELGYNFYEIVEKIGQNTENPRSLIFDDDDSNISILSDTFSYFNFEDDIKGLICYVFDSTNTCFCILIIADCCSNNYNLPFYNRKIKKVNKNLWVGKDKRFKFFINSYKLEDKECSFYIWTNNIKVPESWQFIKN